MEVTKEQQAQINEAAIRSWKIKVRAEDGELRSGCSAPSRLASDRLHPWEMEVKVNNFEVKYLLACSQLGFTDNVVLTYPKWCLLDLK